MRQLRHRGFTLIELMVALTIGILLLLLAMPQMSVWMSDNQIRVGAQSVAEGMRMAQAAAISRNLNTQFKLDAGAWSVLVVDTGTVIETTPLIAGSRDVTFSIYDAANGALATPSTVTFNPLGQVIANATNIAKVDVTMPAVAGTRPLRVIVSNLAGGTTFYGVKLCDPAFAAADPKGCP